MKETLNTWADVCEVFDEIGFVCHNSTKLNVNSWHNKLPHSTISAVENTYEHSGLFTLSIITSGGTINKNYVKGAKNDIVEFLQKNRE